MLNVLCADIGTTSLKAAAIDENGNVLAFERAAFDFKDDGFEANEWLFRFEECALRISGKCRIDAVCISGNGPTLVSESGRTVFWNDKTEIPPFETKSLFIPKLCIFRRKYPEEFASSSSVFSGPEFLVFKLTGKKITVLPEERYRTAYWTKDSLFSAGFTDEEQKKLPSFVPAGFNAGKLLPEIQKKTGLSEIPVFACGPDFVAAIIGTNTLVPGKICDRSGSSEGINLCVRKPVFKEGIRTLPSVLSGLWNLSVLIPESGSRLERFKAEIDLLSGKKNSWEEIMDYCFSDKNSEGFHEMLKICGQIRSGISLLRKAAEESGQKIDDVMTVSGGQAKNEKWLSQKALNSGISIQVSQCRDSELLGDACVAFYSLGLFKSMKDAAENLVKIEKTFESSAKPSGKYTIYKIPEKIKTIIFDIDSTLYTSESYAIEQVDIQIRHIAKKLGMTNREARNMISEFRRKWKKEHGGKISLGNTLVHFGISIQESIEIRKNLLEPEKFLSKDKKLYETLLKLKEKYRLICVTNNPVLPAKKTLSAIGIENLIPEIIGLDTCGKSKPAKEPFLLAAEKTSAKPEECLSVGDRYEIDISLPLELGMGGILVSGVQDVYRLPEILGNR